MATFPTFRHHKTAIHRGDYAVLDNVSDTDSVRVSATSNWNNKIILCDRCWTCHERQRATKHCMDCKENLCTVCAQCDEITRPRWLPYIFIKCWRFVFPTAYRPHSITDLHKTDEDDRPHWALTHEAQHVQSIPRVKKSSISAESADFEKLGEVEKISSGSVRSFLDRHRGCLQNDTYSDLTGTTATDNLYDKSRLTARKNLTTKVSAREYSKTMNFNVKRRMQKGLGKFSMSSSTNRLPYKYEIEKNERLQQYNVNWDRVTDKRYSVHPRRRSPTNPRRFNNKLMGKDIDIDFTKDDVKLIVNESTVHKHNKCAIPKMKTNSKTKDATPGNYTEQIFDKVPIWFKKTVTTNVAGDSSVSQTYEQSQNGTNGKRFSFGNREHLVRQQHDCEIPRFNKVCKPSFTIVETETNREPENTPGQHYFHFIDPGPKMTPYIVEEPVDLCPICLEDLPKFEARMLTCAHMIHTQCLIQLLCKMEIDFGIRCPVCSQTTVIKNYYSPKEQWYKELKVLTTI